MTPPPAGSPNYIMRHVDTEAHGVPGYPANDILEVWAFSVNWTTPASSTFTKIADILTAEFDSTLCGLTSFYCMGMPGVAQGATNSLDPLREVIMHRLAYRNFGTHQALVGNFVTDIGGNIGGIRWFELRKSGAGAWTLYQEGTYAPTTLDNRWMGGIAMDGFGQHRPGLQRLQPDDLPLPALRRAAGLRPAGQHAAGRVHPGQRFGQQRQQPLRRLLRHEHRPDRRLHLLVHRRVERRQPVENPHRRLPLRRLRRGQLSLNVTPESQQVCAANDAVYNVTLAAQGNFAGLVTLSTVDAPGTASFDPNPVTPPGISVLTVSGAPVGAYNFDVAGTSDDDPPIVQSRSVALEVISDAPSTPALLTPATGVQPTPRCSPPSPGRLSLARCLT
jgi:hypothetical protein